MKKLKPGEFVDGFEIIDCVHTGGMAHIYKVKYASSEIVDPGFALAMKIPRMSANDGAENIISFEVELQILPQLMGEHVPRFVASGDISKIPYIVMEYIEGKTIDHWLNQTLRPTDIEIAKLGEAMAHAVHSLHKQNVCHHDLKPANVIIRPDGRAVLLDFGLSYHAHFPDLLAEEMRKAVGSPAWIAPEQIVGVRGDPRSDIFAIGVILYELTTGELPFGAPVTVNGLRQRLWVDPVPPKKRRPEISEWLQEVILCCLEPIAENRYPSAAHLAIDLASTEQIVITERGKRTQGTGLKTHFVRWLKAAGMHYKPSPLPTRQIEEVPIVMVAVPYKNMNDETLFALREAVSRSLGIRPGARLTCVTIIPSAGIQDGNKSETIIHRKYLTFLKDWARPLNLINNQVSYHVLESPDVASALLLYAKSNHVNMIIMGAATHGLKLQNFVATVPIKVAMQAPCTIILVK